MKMKNKKDKNIKSSLPENQLSDTLGGGFITTPKEAVPMEISRLLYEYRNNFGEKSVSILNKETNHKEKLEQMLAIFRKEAKFHIRFERIHPFSDGNGRTGRIVLNRNLIKQGLAPVIITDISIDKYKQFINDNDEEEFARWLFENSNQTLTLWLAELHSFRENLLSEDNLEIFSSEDIQKFL